MRYYRRNADRSLRDIERLYAQDPSRGMALYSARRRVGMSVELVDYEALASFEVAGGEIPYEIDLELEFPYEIARHIWNEQPSLQAWYRLNKVQRDAWEIARINFLANLGDWDPDDPYYSISEEIWRGPLREFRRDFLVELSDNELADLWITDIENRLKHKRGRIGKQHYSDYHEQTTDGLIEKQVGNLPELIRIIYDIEDITGLKAYPQPKPRRADNGSMFILHYGKDCCYDTPDYYGGTVHIQVFGYRGSAGRKAGYVDFSIIEYGRHWASLVPRTHLGRVADWVPEEDKIDFNTFGIISGSYPSSYTPDAEEIEKRDIPPIVPIREIVNGEHLFDLLREKYQKHIPGYKEIFESAEENLSLTTSKHYHPHFPHIWQISRLVSDRVKLLDILGIPHKGGKIPGNESGEYYFQQYKFILYPSRGKPGKYKGSKGRLMRLYVVCPITGREIPTGRWTQYAPTLLKT